MQLKNKLLSRQLVKLGLDPGQPPSAEAWSALLQKVDARYTEADEDRYLMERSLEISSLEMRDRFSKINMLVDQLQVNQAVLKDLVADSSFESIMSNLASNIERRMAGFNCAIFRFCSDTQKLELIGAPTLDQQIQISLATLSIGGGACPCGQAAHFKKPIVYKNDASHPSFSALDAMNVRSVFAYPVLNSQGEVVSVFSLLGGIEAELSPSQAEVMSGLGEVIQMAFTYADIKKAMQKEHLAMVARSKMTTLGEMAGGVAHEINNPLFILQGYVDLIRVSIDDKAIDPQELTDTCEAMAAAVHRIARIVRTLRNFSRDASEDPLEPTSIEVVLSDALELCSKRYEGVKVELIYPEKGLDAQVLCRPVEMVQVVINLLNNSYDAIKGSADPWIRVEVGTTNDGRIEIRVTDSGTGLPEKARTKLFQPFATTKPAGQGTGLGLSISKKIVESHMGRLFYNSSNRNTQFVVDLPLHKEAA